MELPINKVIQGDCLEILKGIPDMSIDLVVTDPPYGMNYQSSRRTDKHEKIALDDRIDWFTGFAKELYRVMKDNTHIYIFCNEYALSHFRDWLGDAGFTNKRTLVWVKNNHTSGDLEGDYGNKTEFILYAQKGRRKLSGKRETNTLFYARETTDEHPTKKPQDLCAFLISKSSDVDEIVLDPFAGVGTTPLAALTLDRKFIGIEISQAYCDIANRKIKNHQAQPSMFTSNPLVVN